MGNLLKDVESETVDLVVHMGDHAYSIGEGDERRDDAYMAAFEPVIANCPWMPIVGIVSVGRCPRSCRCNINLEMTWTFRTCRNHF